ALKSFKGFSFITFFATAFAISFCNSSVLPMMICSLRSSLVQIGSGMPQKRERDKFQSFKFSNQLPKRPVPVVSGFQLIVLFKSIMRSFNAVVLINQLSNG